MAWDAQSETLMETGNICCFRKYRLSFLRNWNMYTLSQWMSGICFFRVLFLFILIQLPKNLHVGILCPNKAGNYAITCEAELLFLDEVITVSYIFWTQKTHSILLGKAKSCHLLLSSHLLLVSDTPNCCISACPSNQNTGPLWRDHNNIPLAW